MLNFFKHLAKCLQSSVTFPETTAPKQLQDLQQEIATLKTQLQTSFATLRDYEKRLAQVLDALPVGVAVLEANGTPFYINQRAQQLLGKDIVAGIITDPTAEVYPVYKVGTNQPYPSMDQPAIRALLGESATADDMEIHQPDKIIPIEVWATPIVDEQKKVVHSIIAFQDITERQRIQELQSRQSQDLATLNAQLQEYSHYLEQKVAERTAELEAQTQEAIRANQTKTRFLAVASHDLRQPLHALRLFVEVLENRINDDDLRPLVQKIQHSITALASLFDALLDSSRLDAGIIQPDLQSFYLSKFFNYLHDEFYSQAEQKGLSLIFDQSDFQIQSDPVLLERILRNLLTNALKYTDQGEIRVNCQKISSSRAITGGDKEYLQITVSDTGVGIPEEQQEEIFTEFHQLQNPDHDRLQGLGLGLSIVKRLAQLLEHPLAMQSKVGQGSSFTITVPLSQETTATIALSSLSEDPDTLFSGRILVIDDEAFVRRATKLQLESWGYQVLTADSQETALQRLLDTNFLPEVILADYRLRNRKTGIEAIHYIQSHLGKTIPSILVTGDTATECLKDVQASGYKLLYKPVKPAHLRKLISYCLRQAKRGDAPTG
jgi:signal transduction histidine kinase/ActR/RegA family two-component response regulator